MLAKPLDQIGREDIESLIANAVREGRQIDYKVALPGKGDADKKEFLADVSSFANASGGDLIFGVTEKKGVPTDAHGLAGIDADAEIQRLDNVSRDGIDPRIPGVQMRAVEGLPQGPVLLVRIPRSWASPHMVRFKNLSRFYTRNNAGKYQMDVAEIRGAFALSESLPAKVRAWRTDRLAKITAYETPLPLIDGPIAVLHLLPVEGLGAGHSHDPSQAEQMCSKLDPPYMAANNGRYNFDGYIRYFQDSESSKAEAYTQFFRNGAIEAVDCQVLRTFTEQTIPSHGYEENLLSSLWRFVAFLREVGVNPPILVMLSLLQVNGLEMALSARERRFGKPLRIDRDTIVLPEVIMEDLSQNCDQMMQGTFDTIWQAAGWPRSLNYNNHGRWLGAH